MSSLVRSSKNIFCGIESCENTGDKVDEEAQKDRR